MWIKNISELNMRHLHNLQLIRPCISAICKQIAQNFFAKSIFTLKPNEPSSSKPRGTIKFNMMGLIMNCLRLYVEGSAGGIGAGTVPSMWDSNFKNGVHVALKNFAL